MSDVCRVHEKTLHGECPVCLVQREKAKLMDLLRQAEARLGGYMGERFKEVEELRREIRAWIGRPSSEMGYQTVTCGRCGGQWHTRRSAPECPHCKAKS